MKTYTFLLIGFLSITQWSNAQYKQDIGLKIGYDPVDRYQLEYRWHANEKWSFVASANYGNVNHFSNVAYPISDTVIAYNFHNYNTRYVGGSIGVQRRLNFMKHNFYYVGATIGGGGINRDFRTFKTTMKVDSAAGAFYPYGDVVSEEESVVRSNDFFTKTKLYLGADVPIVNRLSLNCELGLNFGVSKWSAYSFNSYVFEMFLVANAGLRYRFGKDKE